MKKIVLVLSVLAMCGFVFGACGGDDDGNPCTEAGNLMLSAWDDACSGKGEECCFCECWLDGRKMYDAMAFATDGTCTCEAYSTECEDDPDTDVDECACEGDAKASADACLADKDACKAAAADYVTNGTTGMCTTSAFE